MSGLCDGRRRADTLGRNTGTIPHPPHNDHATAQPTSACHSHRTLAGEPVVHPRASRRTRQHAACQTTQPPILNEKYLFAYKQKGRGTLAGQSFLVSSAGKATTQAGAPVHLIPITPTHVIGSTTTSEPHPVLKQNPLPQLKHPQ